MNTGLEQEKTVISVNIHNYNCQIWLFPEGHSCHGDKSDQIHRLVG